MSIKNNPHDGGGGGGGVGLERLLNGLSARGRQPFQSFTLINLSANLLRLGEVGGGSPEPLLTLTMLLICCCKSLPP